MKNLPEIFPVRYAVVAEDVYSASLKGAVKSSDWLFKQLLRLIQSEPLTADKLKLKASSMRFTDLGIPAFTIEKLDPHIDWDNKIRRDIHEQFPGISWNYHMGATYNLNLVSYAGRYEIPVLVEAHNKKGDIDFLHDRFGYSFNRTDLDIIYELFEELKNGNLSDTRLWSIRASTNEPVLIEADISSLWEHLEDPEGMNKGVLSSFNVMARPQRYQEIPPEPTSKRKIQIYVCKSWDSLMVEELYALKRATTFCLNCGKGLPYGSRHKYCPDNPECRRARDRERARRTKAK